MQDPFPDDPILQQMLAESNVNICGTAPGSPGRGAPLHDHFRRRHLRLVQGTERRGVEGQEEKGNARGLTAPLS